MLPSGLTARPRGSSASRGTRSGAAPGLAGSNTSTLLAWEHDTKARAGRPAKTTSQGSSSVASVATTRSEPRSTTLTLSDTWFTTQASLSERARTETGSSPTGTAPSGCRHAPLASKTSRRLSAVLTANSRAPLGVRSSGCTWGVSQFTKS